MLVALENVKSWTFQTDPLPNVGQSKLNLDGIRLDSPALQVRGKGFIGFDQAVTFDLAAHLLGGGTRGGQVASGGSAGAGIQVSVYWYCKVPTSTA